VWKVEFSEDAIVFTLRELDLVMWCVSNKMDEQQEQQEEEEEEQQQAQILISQASPKPPQQRPIDFVT